MSGLQMPNIGLGTWGMGGRYEADPSNFDSSVIAIKEALEVGFRLIDTAEIYGAGLTEKIVGRGIIGFPREEIFLVSKVWKTNLDPYSLRKSLEGTLDRLQTSYLDLYLIHWPNPDFDLENTLTTLLNIKEEGLIRNIGVSNFDEKLVAQSLSILGSGNLFANQIELSLAVPTALKNLVPYCLDNNIKVQAYRPLNRGVLARESTELMTSLAEKYNKSPAQVALNWVICQGAVPIVKASGKTHLIDSFASQNWSLEPGDVDRITTSVLSS